MAYVGQTLENRASGERITFRRTAAQTGGELVAIELELPPGGASRAPCTCTKSLAAPVEEVNAPPASDGGDHAAIRVGRRSVRVARRAVLRDRSASARNVDRGEGKSGLG
jgi:hypothetical protein